MNLTSQSGGINVYVFPYPPNHHIFEQQIMEYFQSNHQCFKLHQLTITIIARAMPQGSSRKEFEETLKSLAERKSQL
jgi:hypothetical protein